MKGKFFEQMSTIGKTYVRCWSFFETESRSKPCSWTDIIIHRPVRLDDGNPRTGASARL